MSLSLGDIVQLTLQLKLPGLSKEAGPSFPASIPIETQAVTCFGLVVEINQSGVPLALTERGPRVCVKPQAPDPISLAGRGILQLPLPIIVSPLCTRDRVKTTRCGIWHTSARRDPGSGQRILFSQCDDDTPLAAIVKTWTAWQAKLSRATARYPILQAVQFMPTVELSGRPLTRSGTSTQNRHRSLSGWRGLTDPLRGKSLDELLLMVRQEGHGQSSTSA